MRDAEETKAKLEETVKTLAATKELADERRSRFASESKRAAENFAACAFSLCAFFRVSLYQMERDTESVRVELRDTKTRFFKLSGDLRACKDDVARLQSRNASLETKLRETKKRSEQDAVLCASLVQQSEDAERVSRLRVAYARECERRLAVTEAEKIRLTRALDARGGE
jgi:septal ring factor EnvC (AmiA/AmiB activator)